MVNTRVRQEEMIREVDDGEAFYRAGDIAMCVTTLCSNVKLHDRVIIEAPVTVDDVPIEGFYYCITSDGRRVTLFYDEMTPMIEQQLLFNERQKRE